MKIENFKFKNKEKMVRQDAPYCTIFGEMNMKKINRVGILAICLAWSLSGCGLGLDFYSPENFTFDGTVTYLNFEGGFYGIISDDGSHYYPRNLDDSYKVDGIRIRVTAKFSMTTFSAHMWGADIKILKIERIE